MTRTRSSEGPDRSRPGVPLHRLRLLAPAVAATGIAAVSVYDVPVLAVGVAGAAILLSALVPTGRDPDKGVRQPVAAGPSRWPDSGMKLVVEAIGDPCILTDPDGLVRYQNRAASERLGPPRPGDPLAFRVRAPELLAAVEAVGAGGTSPPVHLSDRVPTERYTVAHVTAIRSGRIEGSDRVDFVMVRLVDDTERVRMDRMRGDFIANASHELRTPLASLTGFIETLLGPARNDEANRERFLRIMLDQSGRMARLIDDLLSLSRIEMKVHVSPSDVIDLAPLAAQVADLLGPVAAESGATLEVSTPEGPALVRGDRDELVQVILNLTENAIKYGRQGGRVGVALTAERGAEGAAGWLLSVSDEGAGIAPEHLPRLTERFYRVEPAEGPRPKGTGLGLAIVKHIVARHRGRLGIRSTVGAGSTFSVWLRAEGGT